MSRMTERKEYTIGELDRLYSQGLTKQAYTYYRKLRHEGYKPVPAMKKLVAYRRMQEAIKSYKEL